METIKDKNNDLLWDDAYNKVDQYLLALRIKNRRVSSRLVYIILDRAANKLKNNPDKNPTTLAIEEAQRITTDWYDKVLGKDTESKRIPVQGRVAMLLADVPNKWLRYFLEDGPWPEDFIKIMRESYVTAGPDFQKSRMLPRALKFTSAGSVIAGTVRFLGKRPYMKWLIYWGLIAALFVSLFYYTR